MPGSRFNTRIVFSATAAALLLVANLADSRTASADDTEAGRPKIGLVLAGGGARGLLTWVC